MLKVATSLIVQGNRVKKTTAPSRQGWLLKLNQQLARILSDFAAILIHFYTF